MEGKAVWKNGYVLLEHDHVSEAENIFQRIRDTSALFESGAPPKLLVDSRFYRVMLSNTDQSDIAARVRNAFPENIQIAVLLKEASTADQVMPIIRRLNQAGVNIRTFSTVEQAEAWLGVTNSEDVLA